MTSEADLRQAIEVWLRLLADAGFDPEAVTEQTTEDRTPREVFIGHRPYP